MPALAVAQGSEHTYFHPKLRDKEMIVNRLVLLPPAVHVSKNGVKGQEGMGAESEKATAYFALEVAAALTAKVLPSGLRLRKTPSKAMMNCDPPSRTCSASLTKSPPRFSQRRMT